jgi:hypothetical protein
MIRAAAHFIAGAHRVSTERGFGWRNKTTPSEIHVTSERHASLSSNRNPHRTRTKPDPPVAGGAIRPERRIAPPSIPIQAANDCRSCDLQGVVKVFRRNPGNMPSG